MIKISDLFPRKFLSGPDLQGKEWTLEIRLVVMEEMTNQKGKKEEKAVVYFQKTRKGLVLNVTNGRAMAALFESDTSDLWIGEEVTLYAPVLNSFGVRKPVIRVKDYENLNEKYKSDHHLWDKAEHVKHDDDPGDGES